MGDDRHADDRISRMRVEWTYSLRWIPNHREMKIQNNGMKRMRSGEFGYTLFFKRVSFSL